MQSVPQEVSTEEENVTNGLDRNYAMEAVRVTECAALAASRWMGKGDEKAADQAAVNAMRWALNTLSIDGTVVIGEGERDKAPMLYIGEKVGSGEGPEVDVALDPLEGTTICAHGTQNALAVVALAEKGGFLHAPDVYMQKIAVGNSLPEGVVNIDDSPKKNLQNVAKAKGCDIEDLVVVILDRDRHEELIASVREAGARIQLIGDGDVAGIIATTRPAAEVDIYMGTGGAPEGVLAAAALRCTGGQMQGRLVFNDDQPQIERAKRMGIEDLNKIYTAKEMATGNVMFSATGVTTGWMLPGVVRGHKKATTHSIVMRSHTGTTRTITTDHNFMRKEEIRW
jgi:fructose-1,6-bisphosphatase II / sedoheptulose-1,7-bisphosphatase